MTLLYFTIANLVVAVTASPANAIPPNPTYPLTDYCQFQCSVDESYDIIWFKGANGSTNYSGGCKITNQYCQISCPVDLQPVANLLKTYQGKKDYSFECSKTAAPPPKTQPPPVQAPGQPAVPPANQGPVQPVQPAAPPANQGPVQPPVQPVQPVQPAAPPSTQGPVQPVQPVQPAAPPSTQGPVQPVQPVQPAPPTIQPGPLPYYPPYTPPASKPTKGCSTCGGSNSGPPPPSSPAPKPVVAPAKPAACIRNGSPCDTSKGPGCCSGCFVKAGTIRSVSKQSFAKAGAIRSVSSKRISHAHKKDLALRTVFLSKQESPSLKSPY
ncbi:hypothetical protein E6O75_ATG10877 [Venturia nashicola]|uniref:Uncharacterized protein n=1 Tax=Venturia nashicola TaxID=86259 RepID=A0A4Z1P0I2_9PEZI|nr:hypothetical protein E6O75_ATG10877 [Venturia nashicola]